MTSKTNAGGGSKDRVTWKIEKAVHNFVHAGHHEFFYGLGKIVAAAVELFRMGRGETPLQTAPRVFEHFFSAWQSRERMGEDA